tara:strand:+ start:25954 stop:26730 length:777 start_codon:yes stop_codon:yes gene_type:complete
MSKDILVFSCAHTDPSVGNERFDWLGNFIADLKPDIVVDLGDGADMASLNSYDTRYPKAVVMQNYGDDINHYNDAQERLRHPYKRLKKKKLKWVGFEGNHEHRIKKAISEDPRSEDRTGQGYGVSFKHLQTDYWFDEYHEYENAGPGIANYCGVDFAHYFSSGNYGSATSGIHHAYSVINNRHNSSICGHSHKRDVYFKDNAGSIGLVVGCYKGHEEHWAGQANRDWWHGVVLLKDCDSGMFEPQFVSLDQLEKSYGG